MAYWDTPGKSDEWYTPRHVFDALGCAFDLDVAHPKDTETFVPARRSDHRQQPVRTLVRLRLDEPAVRGRNGLDPWLDRFFEHGCGIALVPDRTSAPWFREAWAKADLVLFTPKLRFHRPDGSVGKSPSNGTALLGVGERAQAAPTRAAARGLGILGRPIREATDGSDGIPDVPGDGFRACPAVPLLQTGDLHPRILAGDLRPAKNCRTISMTGFGEPEKRTFMQDDIVEIIHGALEAHLGNIRDEDRRQAALTYLRGLDVILATRAHAGNDPVRQTRPSISPRADRMISRHRRMVLADARSLHQRISSGLQGSAAS
ncbi:MULTISPECIES: hypothetical protein [Shinella]|jgi:hypothetical protein|uniref:hypothetical protein n=1 Tax=Shinella TaxID=323620 RepID=UPI001F3B22A0|nr:MULTISPECIES: hypothetical protein [Shinella]